MSPELEALIKAAKTRADAMSPVEREAMYQAQRESWVRGETGMGETSAMMPPHSPTPSPAEIAGLAALDTLLRERDEARQTSAERKTAIEKLEQDLMLALGRATHAESRLAKYARYVHPNDLDKDDAAVFDGAMTTLNLMYQTVVESAVVWKRERLRFLDCFSEPRLPLHNAETGLRDALAKLSETKKGEG